jgi:hypothetical protein
MQNIYQEILRQQADMEEDRDDDLDFNEAEESKN